jgi:hypothetical protein
MPGIHGRQTRPGPAIWIAAGWTSKKGLYEALDEHLGLKPSAVRNLPSAETEDLIASLCRYGRQTAIRSSPR